ncbi:MAG TPA: tetratricopeptide repeat protein [candidate division Zixibacteria bacterium]|nr:tetratricopeptide repeat protein [candidate division Zixibacteria bacterium]
MRAKPAVLAPGFLLLWLAGCAAIDLFHPAQASFQQGVALFNRGQFREAIPYFEQAIHDDPNFAQAYLYLGRSHLSLRQWREALHPLRTAYQLAPGEAKQEVFNLLTDVLFAAAVDGLAPERPRSP